MGSLRFSLRGINDITSAQIIEDWLKEFKILQNIRYRVVLQSFFLKKYQIFKNWGTYPHILNPTGNEKLITYLYFHRPKYVRNTGHYRYTQHPSKSMMIGAYIVYTPALGPKVLGSNPGTIV